MHAEPFHSALKGSAPLLAVALLFGCGGLSQLAWVERPPAGCAVGSSGPTLNPGNAIRYARRASVRNLATDSLGVDVQSELRTTAVSASERTRQRTTGILRDARIVALFTELDDSRDPPRVREVHALACLADRVPGSLEQPPYPAWVLQVPESRHSVCALGVSGPTWDPRDQAPNALADGRRALAAALESHVMAQIDDDGRGLSHISSWMSASERAIAAAERADALDEQWLDERGRGPLGLANVLYGLVCVDR